MKTNYTIEIQRHNVTPAQFLAYVRRRLNISESGRLYNEICEFEFDDEKTGHGYYYLIDAETDEAAETVPAAEPETETAETTERAAEINPMCTDCTRRGTDCDGTTCETWTGCIYRKTAYRSAAELAAARRARGWAVCKRDLLALAGGGCKPLRWVCIRYKLSFYGLDPYDMGAELMAGGVRIVYDDTAISPADNRAEQRRVQRAYMAREGARA